MARGKSRAPKEDSVYAIEVRNFGNFVSDRHFACFGASAQRTYFTVNNYSIRTSARTDEVLRAATGRIGQ